MCEDLRGKSPTADVIGSTRGSFLCVADSEHDQQVKPELRCIISTKLPMALRFAGAATKRRTAGAFSNDAGEAIPRRTRQLRPGSQTGVNGNAWLRASRDLVNTEANNKRLKRVRDGCSVTDELASLC